MAVPNPSLTTALNGLVFLMTAEAGMIIDGFDYEASGTMEFVYDASLGYDVGFVEYNFQLSGSVKGKIISTASNGNAALVPGVSMTLGNSTSLNGISAGAVWHVSTSGSHGEKAFREVTVNWIKKPGMTA